MEAQAARGGDAAVAKQRRLLSQADNPLVRVVGRLPVKVRTKLLVAFVGTAVLVVAVGLLGLRVLGQANDRVGKLGALQQRAAAYGELRSDASQVRTLLAAIAGGNDVLKYAGQGQAAPSAASSAFQDQIVASALARIAPATNLNNLGFVPPAGDESVLRRIRAKDRQLSAVMKRITAFDRRGATAKAQLPRRAKAEQLAIDLELLATNLASTTQDKTNALIALNRSSYTSSRNLFVGVAAGAIVLALLLGFVLSWSVTGPLQRTEARLAEIASGDFSRHVEVPNRDELGALAANLNRMNDELGRLYGELETVSRHKSEFLANMSHELRTPLNAIIGFSEVLQQQMFGELNEQQLGYVDDVLDAGRHLLSLINDILDLAKVEAGRMELELADVSLAQTLQSGLTMQGERATRDGITLDLTVDPGEIVIQADERKLRQVVFNLLSNAVKFTPPGGRIDVSAQMTDGVVEVAVTDTGSGIAPEDQELIFEEFQQARGGDAGKRQQGTGLGLPLSRKFIELHGGRLWVESAEGEGSTFRFTLPVEQPA